MKKTVLRVLSLICLLSVGVIALQNLAVTTSLQLATVILEDVSVGLVSLAMGLLSALAALFWSWARLGVLASGQRKANRQLEQAQVTAESSSEKVRAMESKIAALEKALDMALKENETLKAR
jgi:hypothetical protein